MEPYLDGKFPTSGNTAFWNVELAFEEVSEQLSDAKLLQIIKMPESDKTLLVTKSGLIWSFDDDDQELSLVLDISALTADFGNLGLYQLAFHPEFGNEASQHKNEVFIFYIYEHEPVLTTVDPMYNRLSKFEFDDDHETISAESEIILISQYDRSKAHNGGSMFFGKDGFLYVTLGDEGKSRDFYANSQKIDQALFSGVIRIDVNMDPEKSHPIRRNPLPRDRKEGFPVSITQNYFIPNDNPWISDEGLFLEEFYAIGLRSPHTMKYDPDSDRIFVADVGQVSFEEITEIKKGSNAQWAYKEGNANGFTNKPDPLIGIETPPILTYGRDFGHAIIGGGIYKGNKFPKLYGKYLFGDFVDQTIWALDLETYTKQIVCRTPISKTVGFYMDEEGDIYIFNLDGVIHKLIYNDVNSLPGLLSETGAFSDLDLLTPSEGILPYDVASKLWSDRANKRRWVSIPEGEEKVNFSLDSAWEFPQGSVFIKHFELPTDSKDGAIKLETRFLVVDENKQVYGVTYKWNEEGTDALLILDGEVHTRELSYELNEASISQSWSFPTRSECLSCHNSNAGFILGSRANQLNKDYLYHSTGLSKNQLDTWNHLNLFSTDISTHDKSKIDVLKSLSDPIASDEVKVRSYLASNCSYCHMPGGVDAAFDARFSTALPDQHLIYENAIAQNSNENNYIIQPSDTAHSELWIRDNSLSPVKMPPIGKNVLDTAYLSILSRWINNLSLHTDVWDTVCYGENYEFPDGSILEDLQSSVTHTSKFSASNGLDSLININVFVNPPELCTTLGIGTSNKVLVFPNPLSTNRLNILGLDKISDIKMFDLGGLELNIKIIQLADKSIQLLFDNSVKPGIYLLMIKNEKSSITQKVLIKGFDK